MRSKQRRWTVFVVAIWVAALGMTAVLAPTPADASASEIGWMVYSPNHPAGCSPLPFDCYVVWVYPDS